jgi:2-succinyl-5-enolpyruvyl-6-hydroxy-3-cyclohexene-1-carboxylate synthase
MEERGNHDPGAVTEGSLGFLIDRISQAHRPLIIAGPETVSPREAGSVFGLARSAGFPIFADVASGLRFAGGSDGVLLLSHADLFLRDERVESHHPDLVLRLGGVPTSKPLAAWLARHRPPVVAIQPDARRRDPDGIIGETIQAPVAAFCELLRGRCRAVERDGTWFALLREAEKRAEGWCMRAPLEGAAVREACTAVPQGASIFLSNSMPIRWAEMYASVNGSGARVFVNRGVNGIDGIISTALGACLGSDTPMLLVTGDLALLHDLGGLRAAAAMRRNPPPEQRRWRDLLASADRRSSGDHRSSLRIAARSRPELDNPRLRDPACSRAHCA